MLDRTQFLRPIAHRGLHDASRGVIENTAPAFQAAIARGYGIECDLRPAAGGVPAVFHDATLDRLIEGTGPVTALTQADLARLRYRGSAERILTFAALLDLVRGQVPLLVEVKGEWEAPHRAFLSSIAAQASAYAGPLALMSFEPAIAGCLKELAPSVARGIVSGSYLADSGGWWPGLLPKGMRRDLRQLTGMTAVDASFCAYEVGALPTPETQALRARGIPVFAWTVRTPADHAVAAVHADAMIFEGFTP